MASSSWQRLGEGFTQEKKESHQDYGNGEFEGKVPIQKRRKIQEVARSQWNQTDLFSNFSLRRPITIRKDTNPSQNENICWSTSSSEEESKVEICRKKSKRSQKRDRGFTKKVSENVKKKQSLDSSSSFQLSNLKTNFGDCITTLNNEGLKSDKTTNKNIVEDSLFICSKLPNVEKKKNSSKWNNSFDDMKDSRQFPKECRKFDNRRFSSLNSATKKEEVIIDECASSSECDDGNEREVKESDVEDIASDVSDGSLHLNNTLGRKLMPGSPVFTDKCGIDDGEINSVPSSIEGGSNSTAGKVGASDWASRFQQEVRDVSPDPGNKEGFKDIPLLNQYDSAKKKQKFSSNSLVCQLTRLINREKSARRFWEHSSLKEIQDKSQKSITLVILSMTKQFSLYAAQCEIVVESNALLNSNNCRVMLTKSSVEDMAIKTGSVIQLFPPWKQLDEAEKITILCANQIRVVSDKRDECFNHKNQTAGVNDCGKALQEVDEKIEISLKWICPCKQDESLDSKQCPAYHSDHYINYLSQMSLLERPIPSSHSVHLHSVQSSGGLSTSGPSLPLACGKSLLQSIQEEKTGMDCMPPIMATVLRVFRHRVLSQQVIRLSVLIEDESGTLAIIQQDETDTTCQSDLWKELYQMERKECICQDFTMVTRSTKDRDPALFQVISHVWMGRKAHLDSQEDPQLLLISRKVPSYCYILQPGTEVRRCFHVAESQGIQEKAKLKLTTLRQTIQENNGKRFSCIAKVIDVQDSLPESSEKSGFYLCDVSDEEERFTAFIPLKVDRKCVPLKRSQDRAAQTCFLQDVVYGEGSVLADEYSTLLAHSTWSEVGLDELTDNPLVEVIGSKALAVQSLVQSNTSNFFVEVSGRIVNVNAENCYSWDSCGECGTEITTVDALGVPVCPTCNKKITRPSTRMHMEVDVLDDSCKDYIIKMDLNQRTISSLLPEKVSDEGYDMDLVLGKPIEASLAFITEWQGDVIRLYQLDI